jgi:predicted O-methyltransferase YrrM
MTQALWTAVDRYFADLLVPSDPALDAALKSSAEAGLPAIHVTPNLGKLLMLMAKLMGARSILEIGTLGGYSTIWLAKGLAEGGRVITLEAEPKHAQVAQANFAQAGLAQTVEVRVGKALDSLPRLAADRRGPFDLIFIDADKPNNPDYFSWAMKLSRRGSLIIIDNVVRDGAVIDAATNDASVKGVRKLNEMMAAEKRISATAIQTVGSKGYDGLAIAVVVDGPAARGSRAYT